MSKGLKIKQLSTFTAGLIVVMHLLFPHHHHKLLHYCSHPHSPSETICHHHSSEGSRSMACHSLNELTVSKKEQNNEDSHRQITVSQSIIIFCKTDIYKYTPTKNLKFCNTNPKLTEQLIQKLLHFRAPPVS